VDIVAAMASATQELAALTSQLEERTVLQQRARHLEAFIRVGTVLLGQGNEEAVPRKPRTAAQHARYVLETCQRPMRAKEIAEYLAQHGLMQGRWTAEVLRTAMRTHPEDFACLRTGLYALRAWPSTHKRVPEP
jgi:Flp pilus assembly CpaE family ATPase